MAKKVDFTCASVNEQILKKYEYLGIRKKQWDPNELDDIGKRILRASQRYDANAKIFKEIDEQLVAEAAKYKSKLDVEFTTRLGDLINLDPRKADHIAEFLANNFNLKAKNLGLNPGLTYSVPGEVKDAIVNSRRLAEGLVESVAQFEGFRKVRELVTDIKRRFKEKGLPTGYNNLDEVVLDVIEVGQTPHMRNVYANNPGAQNFVNARQSKLVTKLADMGFSVREINEMVQSSLDVSARMDEIRAYAQAFGVDVGNVEGIGFFMRTFTPEANKWIKTKRVNSADVLRTFQLEEGTLVAKNALDKSRKTFWFIPEDEALLSMRLNLPTEELQELLQKPKALSNYIHKNLTGKQITELVDTGILSKVPMTTRELSDYILFQNPEMPFKGMSDLFQTNPEVMYDNYRELLSRAAGQSAMARTIFRDGLDAGWAITDEIRRGDLPTFKNFIPINKEVLERYIPNWRNEEVLKKLYSETDSQIYMHPTVYKSWVAIQEISTSPKNMGAFVSALGYWTSFFTRSLLATPQYAARILWSSTVALQSAGGSIFRLHEGLTDYLKVLRFGASGLDNTRSVYRIGDKTFTKQQIVTEYLKRRGGEYVPFTEQTRVEKLSLKSLNPDNLRRGLMFIGRYTQAFGAKAGLNLASEQFVNIFDSILAPLGTTGMFFEQGAKLSALYTLLDERMSNEVGRFISSTQPRRQFKDFKELLRHVDEYFYTWDDPGRVSTIAGKYIVPFASYMLTNPPAQVRHAIRNPRAFINYYRVRSFINSSAAEDESITEGSVPDWILESSPLFLTKTRDNHWITLMSNNYDPIAEGFSTLTKLDEYKQQMLGWYTGTSTRKREQLTDDRSASIAVFQDFFKMTNPLLRNAAAVLLDVNPNTGRQLTQEELKKRQSFWGIHMPPAIKFLLQSYGPFDYIDRTNPFEVFGRPEIRDAKTNEILVVGKPSRFGAERTRIQRDKYTGGEWKNVVNALSVLGFSVKVVDTAYSMQWTYDDIERKVRVLEIGIDKAATDLQAGKYIDPTGRINTRLREGTPEYERVQNEINTQIDKWLQLKMDQARVLNWMNKNGIPRKRVYEELQKEVLEELDMPTVADEQAQKIIDKMIELKRKIGTSEQ